MDHQLNTAQTRKGMHMGNGKLNDLLDNVEELARAIKDVETPEIARVRAKVKIAVAAAKSALSDSAGQVRPRKRSLSNHRRLCTRQPVEGGWNRGRRGHRAGNADDPAL